MFRLAFILRGLHSYVLGPVVMQNAQHVGLRARLVLQPAVNPIERRKSKQHKENAYHHCTSREHRLSLPISVRQRSVALPTCNSDQDEPDTATGQPKTRPEFHGSISPPPTASA